MFQMFGKSSALFTSEVILKQLISERFNSALIDYNKIPVGQEITPRGIIVLKLLVF